MGPVEHIVMLPLMAHGHLIPYLALAKQIHHRTGFTIIFASTPLNIQYLRSIISTNSTSSQDCNIRLAELPYSSTDHGLPRNVENTENLPLDEIGVFLFSTERLRTPFQNLLVDIKEKEGKPPLCVITEIFFGWASDVATSVGAINVTFSTCSAYGILAYMSLWLNLPHRKADSEEFNVPGFPDRCRFHITQLHRFIRMADGADPWSRFMQAQFSELLKGSYGMLCNTAEEVEAKPLEWIRNYAKFPVWSIGPLLPPGFIKNERSSISGSGSGSGSSPNTFKLHSGKIFGISPEMCLQFLDFHDPGSVLYISFGSQNTVSLSQMMELAKGLEESAKPFIWVIRPPIGFDIKGQFRTEWLPQGFEERVTKSSKKGLLVRNWAPQLEILSHKSTGAFLSHCGWNSVMESLSQGVPLIGWPMAAEQAYNSKMLVEEMGVSVELTRGVQICMVGKEVKEVIELVMSKTGKEEEMKQNAAKIRKQIKAALMDDGEDQHAEKGSSIKAFEDFFWSILSRR